MPAAVEKCVESLLAKWEKDPASKPAPKEKDQDAKSQAWAICSAANKKAQDESMNIMFEDGGYGPTFIGAAATNRPYIPQLEETKIEKDENGKEWLRVHLANPGFFAHPKGAFVLNRQVLGNMVANFNSKVLGQKSCYDARHKPELGALGWFEELSIDDKGRFRGKVDPTPVGLEQIRSGSFLYSSMEFHLNFNRSDVRLDLEEATDDFCITFADDPSSITPADADKFVSALLEFLDSDEYETLKIEDVEITKEQARSILRDVLSEAGKQKKLSIELANPYHEPGGSPIGGRFARAKGIAKGVARVGVKTAWVVTGLAAINHLFNGWEKMGDAKNDLVKGLAFATTAAMLGKIGTKLEFDSEARKLEEDMYEEEKKKLQDQIDLLQKERDEVASRAIKLEREVIEGQINSVIQLAQNHRDADGKGHARQFVEWIGKVLKFEAFGDGGTIKLSGDVADVSKDVRDYMLGAVKELIDVLPGTVPLESVTTSGENEHASGDEYDFAAEWKK